MAYEFPTSGVRDGDVVSVPQTQGPPVQYRYDADNNVWENIGTASSSGGVTGQVSTADVLLVGSRPASIYNPFDAPTGDDRQQDVNWYLEDQITELSDAFAEGSVYYGDTKPVEPHNYSFWFDTDLLELSVWYNDQWYPAPIPNLEQVLTAGNVSDKSIILTNAEDDALLLSPEEARIMVAGIDNAVPKLELRHSTGILETSLVALELDENGERFDIECDEKVSNIHFRFGNKEKLDLNKTGDAVFSGRVRVEPGRQGNEAVTYQQLLELEEEIEQLVPTSERGAWNFKITCDGLDGEFCMTTVETQAQYDKKKEVLDLELAQCLTDNADDPLELGNCSRDYDEKLNALTPAGTLYNTDDFSLVTKLKFSAYDASGVIHSFDDIEVGQIIDMLSEDGGYMVGEVTSVPTSQWYEDHEVGVKVIRFKGRASDQCRIKIFSVSEDLDPQELDNFVRNTGDDMTGPLHIKSDTSDSNPAFLVEPDSTGTVNSDIIQIKNDSGTLLFYVSNGGTVSSGGSSGYKPSQDHHLATKKYVDDQDLIFKPARYGWKVGKNSTNTPAQGYVSCSTGSLAGGSKFKFNFKSMDGGFNMLPFTPIGDETAKEIYRYTGSSGAMTAMVLTVWVYQSGGTQMWKGTGEIREILHKKDYLEVTLNSHTKNNGAEFDSSSTYYFTIGGFF